MTQSCSSRQKHSGAVNSKVCAFSFSPHLLCFHFWALLSWWLQTALHRGRRWLSGSSLPAVPERCLKHTKYAKRQGRMLSVSTVCLAEEREGSVRQMFFRATHFCNSSCAQKKLGSAGYEGARAPVQGGTGIQRQK